MIRADLRGLPDLRAALRGIPDKLRVRALRNAMAAGARLVQRAARGAAPSLDLMKPFSAAMYRRGQRKPGTLRKAISVRTSKVAKRAGNVGVFVNVRPAKGLARGAKSAHDPFYWRWINFGWTPASRANGGFGAAGRRQRAAARRAAPGTPARPGVRFLEVGAAKLGAAFEAFKAAIGPQIAKLNKPKAPAP